MEIDHGSFRIFILVFLSAVMFSGCSCRVLPDTYKVCYRNDPQLRKCLITEANRDIKEFVKGIPEIGIVPTDPFQLGDFEVFPKTRSLHLSQKNGVMKGLRNSKILDLIIDPVNQTGFMNLIGNITIRAEYVVGGQILIFPITGQGDSLIKIKGFNTKVSWKWEIFTGKDGKEYTRMISYKIDYDFDDIKFKMTGLFNNDKFLGEAMERIINENSREIVNELGKPAVDLVVERMVKVINHFFSSVPYDEVLPIP